MFWGGFWPSFWGTGWNNKKLETPTKQQKFPWLSDEQIKRLESLTSDPQEQQKLYQQAIQQLQADKMNENRIAAENNLTYQSLNEKDTKQRNYMQSNVRLEQLADLTKQKFWLNADADTQSVINWLMQYAQDKGVSMDSLNDYLAWHNERFLYDTGLKEESTAHKVWQAWTDIAWWAYDSVTSLFRWWGKWLANVIWWTAKQLWADEQKTDELVQSYKDYIDSDWSAKSIGADTESLTYDISKWVWDMAQVLAGEWLLKAWVQSTAKGAELMKYLEKAPTWQKMVAGGLEWAGDMALFSIVSENKLPTTTEEAIGAGLWAVIPWAWALYKASKPIVKKALNKTASQLELSGLLNPAKLNQIKDQLIKEWTDLAEAWLKGWNAEDVGTWMIERWFKWDKPTLISDLWTHAEKSHKLKREILWASDTLHDVESAKKSLQVIHDTIKDVPWLEEKLARVEELMAKDKHTLSELDEIKSILDDTKSIYTLAGDAKAWAVNKWLDKVRKDLRKYIEDEATKEWLGNVKLLNNETQIAKWLQDAISRKDSADMAREMLGVFSKTAIGWAAWYNVWPFDNDTLGGKVWNVIIWALAGKYLFSTKAKTSLASYINKMSGWSKKELERLIAWDISVKKLSKKTQNELAKAFEESGIMEAWIPTEMTEAEYQALLKKYSNSDLPALEFKEWVNDAWKNILAWDSEKIIATPEWVNFREWQVAELPQRNKTRQYVVDNQQKYKDAKIEYDEFLDGMAKDLDGVALKPSLKIYNPDGTLREDGIKRVLEKAADKPNGIDGVTDIVRWTTAVKDAEWMQKAIDWMNSKGIKFDDKFTNPTELWYKDLSFLKETSNWIKAEVQINTPEMLVAKQGRDAINMGVVTEKEYLDILKKAGVEDTEAMVKWQWHKYYEEWRNIKEWIKNWTIDPVEWKAKMDDIAQKSRDYYSKFENLD